MQQEEVQNLKILKLMADNLNPIEKLMTENLTYHVYGVRDRCKLTDIWNDLLDQLDATIMIYW